MKKLLILAVALLVGVGSVFAQGTWEVKVWWGFGSDPECEFANPGSDNFIAAITIYDVANDIIVVDNEYSVEAINVFESIFDVQSTVQAHCNDNTLQNTPSFIIYQKVRMVNLPLEIQYCSEKSTESPFVCSDFSGGGITLPKLILN